VKGPTKLESSGSVSDTHRSPRIARSTLINLAGLVVPTMVGLVTVPLYLRLIGEVRYGVLLLAFTLLGYFGAFDLGLGRAVAQRIARQEDEAQRNHTFWTAFILSAGMGLLGGIALYFLGQWLFAEIFQIPAELRGEAQRAIPWLAAIVPIIALISVLAGALEARQAFLSLNISQIIGVIGLQTFPLLSVAFGHGSIAALVAAALAGRLMGVLVMLWVTASSLPIMGWPILDRAEIGPLLRFGGWISLSGVAIPLLTIIDRLIIGTRLGPAAVTAYTIPFNLTQRLTYLPFALNTTLFPRFSHNQGEDNLKLMEDAIFSLFSIQSTLIVIALTVMHPFLVFWVGPSLAQVATPVAVIILIGIWLNSPSYPCYAFLQAVGRPDIMTKVYLAELLPFLTILWIAVGTLGLLGAALTWTFRITIDGLIWFIASDTLRVLKKPLLLSAPSVIFAATLALTQPESVLYVPMSVAIIIIAFLGSLRIAPKAMLHRLPIFRSTPKSHA
jgi:O-antigen/teichoic acid export membrane protein